MPAVSTLEAVGNTPMIELDGVRPPDGGRIFVKWEGANPMGSIKDRMAGGCHTPGARERGDLEPGQRVAELTGG